MRVSFTSHLFQHSLSGVFVDLSYFNWGEIKYQSSFELHFSNAKYDGYLSISFAVM